MSVGYARVNIFIMEKTKEKDAVFVSAAAINFNSKEVKKAFEKNKEKKKEVAQLAKIDRSKLNVCISV
jgi:hypothetical protein